MNWKRLIVVPAVLCLMGPALTDAADGRALFDAWKAREKAFESSVKTMTLRQTIEAQGLIADVTVYKKGKKMRMESLVKTSPNPMMGTAGDKTIVIDDGTRAWTFTPMVGKMELPHDGEEDLERSPQQVTDLSRETVSGIACRKLDVVYPDGEQERLWIREKDPVLVKEEGGMDNDQTLVVYSDFKTIQGWPFAHRISTYEDGELIETVRVVSVDVNTSVDDLLFNPHRVNGYDQAGTPGADDMGMMQMAMEIKQLYQSGQVEKAKALEKHMQSMIE